MTDETFRTIMVLIILTGIFGMIGLATNWIYSVFLFLSITAIMFWML